MTGPNARRTCATSSFIATCRGLCVMLYNVGPSRCFWEDISELVLKFSQLFLGSWEVFSQLELLVRSVCLGDSGSEGRYQFYPWFKQVIQVKLYSLLLTWLMQVIIYWAWVMSIFCLSCLYEFLQFKDDIQFFCIFNDWPVKGMIVLSMPP